MTDLLGDIAWKGLNFDGYLPPVNFLNLVLKLTFVNIRKLIKNSHSQVFRKIPKNDVAYNVF